MRPCAPPKNISHGTCIKIETPGNLYWLQGEVECANLENLAFIKFGAGMLFPPVVGRFRMIEADCNSMATVLGTGDPFEVSESVVILDTIDVIPLLAIDGRSPEGGEDKPVDLEKSPPPATVSTAKTDEEIARSIPAWSKEATRRKGVAFGGRVQPPYPAQRGNFIQVLIPDDGPPLFRFQGQGELCMIGAHREPPFLGARREGVTSAASAVIVAQVKGCQHDLR